LFRRGAFNPGRAFSAGGGAGRVPTAGAQSGPVPCRDGGASPPAVSGSCPTWLPSRPGPWTLAGQNVFQSPPRLGTASTENPTVVGGTAGTTFSVAIWGLPAAGTEGSAGGNGEKAFGVLARRGVPAGSGVGRRLEALARGWRAGPGPWDGTMLEGFRLHGRGFLRWPRIVEGGGRRNPSFFALTARTRFGDVASPGPGRPGSFAAGHPGASALRPRRRVPPGAGWRRGPGRGGVGLRGPRGPAVAFTGAGV